MCSFECCVHILMTVAVARSRMDLHFFLYMRRDFSVFAFGHSIAKNVFSVSPTSLVARDNVQY